MYYIMYKDPMTGLVLESEGSTLPEAVGAITKARDDLYHKGATGKVQDLGYPKKEVAASEPETSSNLEVDKPSSKNLEDKAIIVDDQYPEDFLDAEDFWYPYGVYHED